MLTIMKRYFAIAVIALLPGCSYLGLAKQTRDMVVVESVTTYCQLPESVRLANRERFKTAPDKEPFVHILCENL